MADEKVIPTPDQIRETFATVRNQISGMDLCLDATIDDYPIGRRERGKSRSSYSYSKASTSDPRTALSAGRIAAPKAANRITGSSMATMPQGNW